jgi:glycosyltransferase involved in cell wall biosynthesis
MNNAILSIIIATYNAEKYLANCLNSIIIQKTELVELILIDGNSTDGTLHIIKKYEDFIDYWISEEDFGIYDAWNKGIRVAKGEWIMFLGADDQLIPDAIEHYFKIIDQFKNNINLVFISSRVKMIDCNNKLIRIKGWPITYPLFFKEMTVAHPGALHSKILFQKFGEFNTNYKIAGDYEFLLRPGTSIEALHIDKVSVIMREGGASDSVKAIKEHFKAVTSTGDYPIYLALISAIKTCLKFFFKKTFRRLGLNVYLRKS